MRKVNNISQLKFGSIISYVQMFLSVIIGVFYTPIMIRHLGQNEYGLYGTVSSTVAMLSILKFGFNNSYIRYFSKYNAEDNKEKLYKLNGLFLMMFTFLGIIALICGLLLTANLGLVFDSGLSKSEYDIAKKLMFLLTINLFISFPMGVFANIITAYEKFVFLKLLEIIRSVISPLVTIPLLLLGFKSVALVTVSLILSIITDLCYLYYTIFVLKVRFIFRDFEKGLFKKLAIYSSFIAINLIVEQINWNIDKVLLARFKGTVSVALYSVGYSIYVYYQMFSTAMSGVFTPRIHKIVTVYNNDKQKMREILTALFVRIGRIQFLLLALIITGLIFFGKQFIIFWVGDGYKVSYYVMLILVISATPPLLQNTGIEIQRALNKHQFRSIMYIFMALLNLIASIFLCQIWGAVGAVIGTAASLVLANGVMMNIYYHKKCHINIIDFWKNILRMALGLIMPIIFGCVFIKTFNMTNIFTFMLGILLYTVVYCVSMWFISMNDYEKDLVKKPLCRIIKRLK